MSKDHRDAGPWGLTDTATSATVTSSSSSPSSLSSELLNVPYLESYDNDYDNDNNNNNSEYQLPFENSRASSSSNSSENGEAHDSNLVLTATSRKENENRSLTELAKQSEGRLMALLSHIDLSLASDGGIVGGNNTNTNTSDANSGEQQPDYSSNGGDYESFENYDENYDGNYDEIDIASESYIEEKEVGMYLHDNSFDNMPRVGYHSSRAKALEEAAQRDMNNEYNFRPEINASPSVKKNVQPTTDSQDLPFHERVAKWQFQRKELTEKRRDNIKKSELDRCSFRPKINTSLSTDYNLSPAAAVAGGATKAVVDRLFSAAEMTEKKKKIMQEQSKLMRAKREEEQCTFKPNIVSSTSTLYANVSPKYQNYSPKTKDSVDVKKKILDPEMKHCTFSPKIIQKSSDFLSQYFNTNVVDRLLSHAPRNTPAKSIKSNSSNSNSNSVDKQRLSPETTSTLFTDKPFIDAASLLHSNTANTPIRGRSAPGSDNNRSRATSASPPPPPPPPPRPAAALRVRARPSSAPRDRSHYGTDGDDKSLKSAMSSKSRDEMFGQFLKNQNQYVNNRLERSKELARNMQPTFKPELNNQFYSEHKNIEHSGSFLDRLEVDILHRKTILHNCNSNSPGTPSSLRDNKKAPSSNTSTTATSASSFSSPRSPRSSSPSTYKSPMSHSELNHKSVVDARLIEKRKEKLEQLKLRTEQERYAECVFQPTTTERAKLSKSKLGILENPSEFLKLHKEKQDNMDKIYREEIARKQEDELRQCTFAPSLPKSPAFISKMKQSLDELKKMNSSPTKEKKDKLLSSSFSSSSSFKEAFRLT